MCLEFQSSYYNSTFENKPDRRCMCHAANDNDVEAAALCEHYWGHSKSLTPCWGEKYLHLNDMCINIFLCISEKTGFHTYSLGGWCHACHTMPCFSSCHQTWFCCGTALHHHSASTLTHTAICQQGRHAHIHIGPPTARTRSGCARRMVSYRCKAATSAPSLNIKTQYI